MRPGLPMVLTLMRPPVISTAHGLPQNTAPLVSPPTNSSHQPFGNHRYQHKTVNVSDNVYVCIAVITP